MTCDNCGAVFYNGTKSRGIQICSRCPKSHRQYDQQCDEYEANPRANPDDLGEPDNLETGSDGE